jgi:hypothetical protein
MPPVSHDANLRFFRRRYATIQECPHFFNECSSFYGTNTALYLRTRHGGHRQWQREYNPRQNRTEVKPDGARKITGGESRGARKITGGESRGRSSGPLRLREAPFGGWGGGAGETWTVAQGGLRVCLMIGHGVRVGGGGCGVYGQIAGCGWYKLTRREREGQPS